MALTNRQRSIELYVVSLDNKLDLVAKLSSFSGGRLFVHSLKPNNTSPYTISLLLVLEGFVLIPSNRNVLVIVEDSNAHFMHLEESEEKMLTVTPSFSFPVPFFIYDIIVGEYCAFCKV